MALRVARLVELEVVQVQRFIDHQAGPVVVAGFHGAVQARAHAVHQHPGVLAPQQAAVELTHHQHRAGLGQRELRGQHQRHTRLVQHMRDAGTRGHHGFAAVAAVAGGQRHHVGAVDAAAHHARYGTGQAFARDDTVARVQAQPEAAVALRNVGGAVGQHMDVGVAVVRTFGPQLVDARLLQDGQPFAEGFAPATIAERGLAVGGKQKGPHGSDHGPAVLCKGHAVGRLRVGVGSHEQNPRILQPGKVARRHVARAPRDDHRHPRLQRHPAFGPGGGADRHLRELER